MKSLFADIHKQIPTTEGFYFMSKAKDKALVVDRLHDYLIFQFHKTGLNNLPFSSAGLHFAIGGNIKKLRKAKKLLPIKYPYLSREVKEIPNPDCNSEFKTIHRSFYSIDWNKLRKLNGKS